MMIAITPIRIIIITTAAWSSCRKDLLVERPSFDQVQPSLKEANRESVADAPPSTDEPPQRAWVLFASISVHSWLFLPAFGCGMPRCLLSRLFYQERLA
jgi:hypothetical protein